jgi:CBS domain-containing protein
VRSGSIARALERKGTHVVTTTEAVVLRDVVAVLAEHGIGAVVVVDGEDVRGIVSERDVVRRLAEDGPTALELPVGDVMTSPVTTCTPDTTTDELLALMTGRRFRHVPVVVDGHLAGIISIGDVVKWNLDELRSRADQLTGYVTGSY